MEFTIEKLKQLFSDKYFHPAYDTTVKLAESLRVHADGIYPEDLIEERRPHESEMVRDYRKKIWQPITKPYFNKVLTSLNKIRRSTEWSIKFEGKAPARIPEGQTLADYLETGFPHFGSLTNWTFSLLLREYAIDANAWIVLMPDGEVLPNELVNPYPAIFRADQVIEPGEGYIVIKTDEKVVYRQENAEYFGDRYLIVTDTVIEQWDQVRKDRTFSLTWSWEHNVGELPAFKMKGVVKESHGSVFIHESRLSAMLARFNEALREYSDLQAEVVQHIHSEKWEVGQTECDECHGTGTVVYAGFGARPHTCGSCHGSGCAPRGPYTTLTIKPTMPAEGNNGPIPPMGYLTKDTNIVEVQDKRVEGHIYNGLAAINMEFLAQHPLNQSGVAKAYDADETNNFVHGCAEDLVAIMDQVAQIINDMRYGFLIPDPEARKAMLPTIAVPESFDLFSSQVVAESLAKAKQDKVHPRLIATMEVDYASKKFSANPEVAEEIALITRLDPLFGVTEDDKMIRLNNGGITKETYIVSCNIMDFIERAKEEYPGENSPSFLDMPLKEQKALLISYAREQAGASSARTAILDDIGG